MRQPQNRLTRAAAALMSAALLAPAPAAAAGALAVGVPGDVARQGFTYGRNIDSPTEADARQRALDLCRDAKDATEAARNRCAIVMSFEKQCVAVTMDPAPGTSGVGWAVAPTREAAERQAMANCVVTSAPDRGQFCVISDSACDGEP